MERFYVPSNPHRSDYEKHETQPWPTSAHRSGHLFILSLSVASVRAEETGAGDPQKKIDRAEDLTTPYILDRINSIGRTKLPTCRSSSTRNYARTSADDEPSAPLNPYKKHYLLQMEYNGAGRRDSGA